MVDFFETKGFGEPSGPLTINNPLSMVNRKQIPPMGSSSCWFNLQWSVWFTFHPANSWNNQGRFSTQGSTGIHSMSTPVTSDTRDRHCSFLSPATFAMPHDAKNIRFYTQMLCGPQQAKSPIWAPSAICRQHGSIENSLEQRVVAAGAGPAKTHQTTWHFRILHDPPRVFLWRSEGYVLQKCCSQSVNDSNYAHHPDAFSFGRNGKEIRLFDHPPAKQILHVSFCRSPNVLMKWIPNQWMPCFKKKQQVETNDSLGVRYFWNIATSSTQKTQNCVLIDYLDWLKGIRKSMNQGDSSKLWWRW